jgi:hypothetical protein
VRQSQLMCGHAAGGSIHLTQTLTDRMTGKDTYMCTSGSLQVLVVFCKYWWYHSPASSR